MSGRYRMLVTSAVLALLALAAWWRFDADGPAAARVAGQAIVTEAPGSAATVQPSRAESVGTPRAPLAPQEVPPPVEPAAEAAALSSADATESAPETSVPGRSLAELERRARAGDAKAARDWVDALERCFDTVFGGSLIGESRFVSHLNANLFVASRTERAQMLKAPDGECRALFPVSDINVAGMQAQSMFEEALRLWAATGDPHGQLVASMVRNRIWPPPADLWRRQQAWATSHLDPGDPQTLIDLTGFAVGSRYPQEEAWRLVACDLGYDCSAGGALQTRLCLNNHSCGRGSYEEGLLQELPPRQWQVVQRQRRELLERLRRGEVRGVFDVPPPEG